MLRCHTPNSVGAMADLAEERKSVKYTSLGPGYSFISRTIETLEAIGKRFLSFLKELGLGVGNVLER